MTRQHIDQYELSKRVAQQTGIDIRVSEAFMQQLFKGVEQELLSASSIKIKNIGLFRIIQSGDRKRILFLGNSTKPSEPKLPQPKPQLVANVGFRENTDVLSVASQEAVVPTTLDTEIEKAHQVKITQKVQPEKVSGQTELESVGKVVEKAIVKTEIQKPVEEVRSEEVNVSQTYTPVKPAEERPPMSTLRRTPLATPDYMNRSVLPKKKSKLPIYIGLSVLVLLIIGTVLYKLVAPTVISQESSVANVELKKEKSEVKRVTRFAEVANSDPINFSCIILVDSDISIQDLAILYYGKNLFWPYIYKANANVIGKNLIVQMNTIIKIPKITVNLVDYSTGILDKKLVAMSDKIKNDLDVK